MSQVGRISGPLLTANLERNGIDLKISNTVSSSPVLKLDVTNNRIGIVKESPIADLDLGDIDILGWRQQQKFTPTGGQQYNQYGYSVDIKGNYAVVGEKGADVGSNANQGKVYVYKKTNETWTEIQQLTATDGQTNDYFGEAVAIDGDTIVVTARGVDVGASTFIGAVYVYTNNGDIWTQQGPRLLPSVLTSNRNFGISADIDGDTIVIGADGVSSGAMVDFGKEGAVYVYKRSGNTWTQQQRLESPTPTNKENFGHEVGISGDTIVAGAYYKTVGTETIAGAAFVFTRSGSTWTQLQELTANDPDFNDRFGASVGIDGDYIVCGAEGANQGQSNLGAVYVFYRSGNTWTQQQKIMPADASETFIGESVDISGDVIVSGSRPNNLGAGDYSGTAYVFSRSGSTWTLSTKFAPDDSQSYDDFGMFIAIDGDSLIVPAVGSPAGQFIGAAYFYTNANPSSLNTTNLIATGTVNVADFSLSNQAINVSSGNIIVNSGSLIEASAVATDDIKIEENNIYGTATQANITLKTPPPNPIPNNGPAILYPNKMIVSESGKVLTHSTPPSSATEYQAEFDTSVDIDVSNFVSNLPSSTWIIGDMAVSTSYYAFTMYRFSGWSNGDNKCYVFNRSTNQLVYAFDDSSSSGPSADEWGATIVMNDSYIAIANYYTGSGGEYVDVYDLNTGSLLYNIPNATAGGTGFGESMCITPDGAATHYLGVAAPFADVGSSNRGAAYVYRLPDFQRYDFYPPTNNSSDYFGTGMDMNKTAVAIAAPGSSHEVYIYSFNNIQTSPSSQTPEVTISKTDSFSFNNQANRFGGDPFLGEGSATAGVNNGVCLTDSYIIIASASYRGTGSKGIKSGKVYQYDLSGNFIRDFLTPSNAYAPGYESSAQRDRFGASIDATDSYIVIGATSFGQNNELAVTETPTNKFLQDSSTGTFYVYDASTGNLLSRSPAAWYQSGLQTYDGTSTSNNTISAYFQTENFGAKVAIDGDNIFAISEGGRTNQSTKPAGYMLFYNFEPARKVDIQSDLDVNSSLHATGNITFGGNITLGSGAEDDITFAADVASNIVPDADNTYIFGRNEGTDSTYQRLSDTQVETANATNAVGDRIFINGIDYSSPVGNSFFVDPNGDDTARGDHPQGAFKTVKHALSAVDSSAGGPTTVIILAGTYTEEFPLTVPSQTNIVGAGFREVVIKPTTATQDKDCFLLTGETTISNLTVMDFFYNSSNDTGYGFRFADNAITSTRSPYIQNVSVITKGTPITVTASSTLSVNSQENNPRGITFNNDGTKMFIVGAQGDDVNEYTLSVGFDLSSTVNFIDSFPVTQCPNPTAVKFNTDGTKMFVTGTSNNNVHEYALSTGFDVSTAGFTQTLVTTVDSDNFGLDFNNDGTKMYITGNSTDSIYEFNLSSAFDISTATLNQSVYLNPIDDEPFGIEFNTDGTRMFIVGTKGNGVDEFKLTTGFDISTATHMGFYFVGNNPSGIHISPDGTKMFIIGNNSDLVKSFDLGTSYRVAQDNDPRGFEVGNAGRGALVDGSVLNASSTQASMLFHSVTFITPGAIGLRMKDGVRVEWLNSFTYFADIGIKAENGGTGFVSPHDGSTRNYGAEIRSIGSANVYGNKGAVADGNDCLMYLIQHNMAYIGTGSNKDNDKTLRIEANETVELNSGKIFFQTTDGQGKFKVGDNFFADFDTGTTSVDANTVAFDTLSEIRINTGSETTFIDGVRTDVGNFVMSGNTLSTSTGNMIIDAITKPEMRSDVLMNADLDITGNFSIGQTLTRIGDELTDTVSFNVDLDQDLKPGDGGLHSLGSTAKRWKNVFVSEANIGNVKFFDNQITTNVSNADLDIVANGSGNILFASNNMQVDNNLEAEKLIVPTFTYTGSVTQTGDIFTNEQAITGNLTTDTLTVARDAFLKQINIEGGNITNVVTNSDMIFRALGTGKVLIPGNNVRLENDIRVGSYQVGGNITFTGDILSNRYSTEDIKIFGTNIQTTLSNSDLELRASGTGSVLVENLFFKNRTITSGPPGVEFGRINLDPAENLILSGTGALKFPVGNVNQRRNQAGDVRFNSQLNVFEGFSTGTVTFGGLFSDDQQTSVQVNPVNNHLDFNVDNSLVGTVNIAQVEMPGLQSDDILIDGKKITTNVSNSDLELTPNGTGAVNIIGNTINLSSLSSGIIKNDSTGALTISATDLGYHKIGGTFGVRIPSGDNSNRDAGDSVPNQIGDTRYNRTNGGFLETWDGNVWQVSAGGGGETLSQAEMEDLILEFSLALG